MENTFGKARHIFSKTTKLSIALVTGLFASSSLSMAEQRGAPQYPVGVDTLYSAALPPVPGLFMFAYGLNYSIGNAKDSSGRNVFNNFDGRVTGLGLRPLYVWDTKVLGARPVSYMVVPILDRSFEASSINTYAPPPTPATVPFSAVNNGSGKSAKFGVGDMSIAQLLNWHLDGGWAVTAGLEIYMPTGDYDKNRFFNAGASNYFTFYPQVSATWRSPENHHVSMKAQYGMSTRNRQTSAGTLGGGADLANYQSGNHFTFEGAAGVGLTKEIGLDLTAYALIQTANDSQNGIEIADSKSRVYGIGPQLRFNVGPGAIALKYQREFDAQNASQGNRVWLQAGFPLWVPSMAAGGPPK